MINTGTFESEVFSAFQAQNSEIDRGLATPQHLPTSGVVTPDGDRGVPSPPQSVEREYNNGSRRTRNGIKTKLDQVLDATPPTLGSKRRRLVRAEERHADTWVPTATNDNRKMAAAEISTGVVGVASDGAAMASTGAVARAVPDAIKDETPNGPEGSSLW